MHYLTRWRMALAAGMLQTSSLSITHVAQDVGYETDPAFSRAFRREFGVPPAAWRGANGIRGLGRAQQRGSE
jgi:AraC-like DNA-binding protein